MKDLWKILIALLVLVGMVLFGSWHKKKTFLANEAEEKASKLVSADWNGLTRIHIRTRTEDIVLEKRPTGEKGEYTDRWAFLSDEFDSVSSWAITKPVEALADYYTVDTLVDNLRNLTSKKVIDEKGADPKAYNLVDPPALIELFGKDPKAAPIQVRIGDENSAKTGIYIQTSLSPKIELTANTLDYMKTKTALDLRKKEILGIKDLTKVGKLDLKYVKDKKAVAISAVNENGQWRLRTPDEVPADRAAIDGILSDLKSLRANSIVSEDARADAKKFGLDHPFAEVETLVTTAHGDRKLKIEIGSKIETDKDIYLVRSDLPQVFTVRGSLKDNFTKDFSQLVSKAPFEMKAEAVSHIEIEVPENPTVKLSKKEGKWLLEEPVADEADQAKIESMIPRIASILAVEYLGKSPPKEFGRKPAMTIRLVSEKAREELVMVDYDKMKEMIGKTTSGRFYRIKRYDHDLALEDLKDVRNRHIYSESLKELSKVKLSTRTVSATFEQTADGSWVLGPTTGVDAPLKAKLREKSTAEALAKALDEVKLESFLNMTPEDYVDSSLRLELTPKKGFVVTWVFGRKDGDQVFVSSLSRKIVGKALGTRVEALENLLKVDKGGKG